MRRYVLHFVLAALMTVPVLIVPERADAEISEDLQKELKGYVDSQLSDGDGQTKAAALLAWGRFADEAGLEKIAEYKTSDEGRLRLAARASLFLAGQDGAREALVKALATQSGLYGVLQKTITALPDEREVELLEALLEHDKADSGVQKAVFRYLADQKGELYGLLGERLDSSDKDVRKAALTAAKASMRPAVRDYALEMAESGDEAVRRTGLDLIDSLSRVPGRRSEAISALEKLVDHDSDDIAQAAATRLLEMHQKSGVDRLVSILVDAEDVDRRKEVANILLAHDISPATDKVKPIWKSAEDEGLKQLGLELTVASGDSEAFKKLIELENTTEFDKRLRAVKALGRSDESKAIEILSKALFEGNADMRLAAAKSLRQIGNPKSVSALKRAMREERDKKVKIEVVRTLGDIGNEEARRALRFSAGAKDPDVKLAIVEAVRDVGEADGVETLQMFFSARSTDVQWQAFLAGMHIAPGEAIKRVKSIFRNPPQGFRSDLEQLELTALEKLYAELLRLDNERVRRKVVRSINRIGEPLFGLVREAVTDSEVAADTRLSLLFALAEQKRESDRVYLQKLVRESSDTDLVRRAAWTLTEYSTENLEATFRGWLTGDDALLKMIASYGIAGIHG